MTATSSAPPTAPSGRYVDSYHLIRSAVGLIGLVLPVYLIVGEWIFLEGPVAVRGSISAYYHSSMRDVFVGALAVVGFLLIMYRSSEPSSPEFRRSFWAGAALLIVVYFPTGRPNLTDDELRCGADPDTVPTGCAPIQTLLGEHLVAGIHFAAAITFIGMLAIFCLYFAREEAVANRLSRAWLHGVCLAFIIVAILWIPGGKAVGWEPFGLGPLYIGELVSVWSFAISWLVKGKDLRKVFKGRAVRSAPQTNPNPSLVSTAQPPAPAGPVSPSTTSTTPKHVGSSGGPPAPNGELSRRWRPV